MATYCSFCITPMTMKFFLLFCIVEAVLILLKVIFAGGRKLDDMPPTFTSTPGVLLPRPIFHDVEFSCEASGSKPMTVTWLHDGIFFNMKKLQYTTVI